MTSRPDAEWPKRFAAGPNDVTIAAIVSAIVCCLFFHGYEIFNFTLSIDEETNLGGEPYFDYLQHGRWGLALRTWLFMPDTTVPITAIGTGLALYGAAFVLLVRHYRIGTWGAVAVAAPLFFGFPVLIYLIAFSHVAFSLGVGAFAAVLALLAADSLRPFRILLSIFLIAFSISMYQSFLYFVVVIFAADMIRRVWAVDTSPDREAFHRMLCYAALVLFGVALYALIEFAVLRWFDLHIAYVTQFVRPDLSEAGMVGAFTATFDEAGKLLTGAAPAFLHHGFLYRVLITLCAAVLVWRLVVTGRLSLSLAALIAGLLVIILVAPFVQHPLNGGRLPYRDSGGAPCRGSSARLVCRRARPAGRAHIRAGAARLPCRHRFVVDRKPPILRGPLVPCARHGDGNRDAGAHRRAQARPAQLSSRGGWRLSSSP